jgi:hypothetical protein
MLRDLPSIGRPISLILHVRRFFCKKSTCAQKIFAERLPSLCHPHAQRTKRLQEALCQLGLRVGGQAGADVGSELGISGSREAFNQKKKKGDPHQKGGAQPEHELSSMHNWLVKPSERLVMSTSWHCKNKV